MHVLGARRHTQQFVADDAEAGREGGASGRHTLLAALRAAGHPTRKTAENRAPGAAFCDPGDLCRGGAAYLSL